MLLEVAFHASVHRFLRRAVFLWRHQLGPVDRFARPVVVGSLQDKPAEFALSHVGVEKLFNRVDAEPIFLLGGWAFSRAHAREVSVSCLLFPVSCLLSLKGCPFEGAWKGLERVSGYFRKYRFGEMEGFAVAVYKIYKVYGFSILA